MIFIVDSIRFESTGRRAAPVNLLQDNNQLSYIPSQITNKLQMNHTS